jgi:two-component system, chemotaxis family, chemotaxis protein CheY
MTAHALIVEDSAAMRSILDHIVTELGFSAALVGDGYQALTLLDPARPPMLIITDLHMPEMTGVQLVRAIRADPRYAATRIVMVTTETDRGQLTAALAAGADDYVTKPFTAEFLRDKLRGLGLPEASP